MSVRCSSIIPNKPTLTEKNLPDQSGKVFLITGGSGGIGQELASILYQHNAKVWIAARSESKSKEVMAAIRARHPQSRGQLAFLALQLDDLSTIKRSAEELLAKETRLDVLFNNAGVMVPPQGSKTKQGYELQVGVNNLAPFLFTALVRPLLVHTAKVAPRNSVRVIWVSSSAADGAPKPAIDFSNMHYEREEGVWAKYSRSKAGNVLHSVESARRMRGTGVLNIALNPGNFVTNLQQNMTKVELTMFKLIAHPPINGAYTELYAGLSEEITEANDAGWISPFGKVEKMRKDLEDPELGRKYWEWSEEQVRQYM
ncbi:hypothetical protein B0J12DRAFT_85079 [Macrophomina phaseolina]|uniref:Short-chain dehydrogenase/reductase SDR n=1 Tax=Macrophomina phaseolina TaxID=35725 RepID=A0ABQ8FPN4_9PEZI|nr:hypothetical protein B0J12DRAFT_85079 [Macrophomina phaseolina]